MMMGLKADLLMGDFDSVRPSGRDMIPRQVKVRDQYSTDFQKALKLIMAPKIYALGFLGQRFDHGLGALHALAENISHDGERVTLCLVDQHDLVVMRQHAFSAPPCLRGSSFALVDVAAEIYQDQRAGLADEWAGGWYGASSGHL